MASAGYSGALKKEINDGKLKEISDNKFCDNCNDEIKIKKEAVKFCSDCEIYFCKACLSCHDKLKTTKDHKVIEIEDKIKNDKCMCKIHAEQEMNMFCIECQQITCEACFNSSKKHKNHNVEKIEMVLSELKDCENILKHFNEIKADILENEKNLCNQIDAYYESTIKNLQSKVIQVKNQIREFKLENISQVTEYENKIEIEKQRLIDIKNDYLKKKKNLSEQDAINEVVMDAKNDDKNIESVVVTVNNDKSNESTYKTMKNYFNNLQMSYKLNARLDEMKFELLLSFNSRLTTKLVKRIPARCCQIMTLEVNERQRVKKLWVVFNQVIAIDLNDLCNLKFYGYPDIPLYGNMADCMMIDNDFIIIKYYNQNAYSYNIYSKDYVTLKIDRQSYEGSMNFCKEHIFLNINKSEFAVCAMLQSSLKPICKIFCKNELILNFMHFDNSRYLGCFYSEETKNCEFRLISKHGLMQRFCYDEIEPRYIYTIPNLVFQNSSANIVIARDVYKGMTFIARDNILHFYTDNTESLPQPQPEPQGYYNRSKSHLYHFNEPEPQVDYLKKTSSLSSSLISFVCIGSIDLEEYNMMEPSKILCHENQVIIMSKVTQDILIFNYDVKIVKN